MARLSPEQLLKLYKDGFQGCLWENHIFESLLENSKYAYFGDGAKKIAGSGKGKLSTPYKSVLKFDKNPYNERQVTGDCLDGNSIVISEYCKSIKDVEVGDKVYDSSGNFTEVISKQVKISNNPLITIKTKGSIPLKVTSDHRVFIGRKENKDFGNVQTKTIVKKWVIAQDIKKGDYLITPINLKSTEKPLSNKFMQDGDFEWFLGYFLGDGWCDNNSLEITFAEHQQELFTRCLNFLNKFNFNVTKCDYKNKNTSAFRLRCWCPELASFLRNICYDSQKNKVFPNWIIGSKNVVQGLVESDGFTKNGKVTFDSKSTSLAYGVYYSYLQMGYKPTINYFHRAKKGSFKDSQSYRVSCIYNKQKNYSFIKNNELYILVSEIEIKEGPHEVYDIGVSDKKHAFLANGCIVHNCVSHSTRNAVDVTRAVEIDINSDKESWIARGATEAIYGARGHGGQGMSCARAAEFVSRFGGVLIRQNYKGVVDLTKYQGMLGAGWGGRGLPDKVIDLANDHQVRTVSLVRTVEEARDALANGYGISVCSSYGFSSKRDSKGFAKPQGSWAHAMAWTACDDTGSEPAFLVQNSWGCYSDDTEVLTKNGWKLFKNLSNVDILATLNPNNHNLEWQQIQQKFEYDYNGYLNHYHFRGVDLLVTDNHNMYVGKLHSDLDDPDSWTLIESKNCPKYIHIKKNARWIGEEIQNITIGKHVISMDLWLEFLGYFISEGHSCNHTKIMSNGEIKSYGLIGISQNKKESREIIKNCLDILPFKFSKNMVSYDKYLYNELKNYGKAHQKYIPDYIKNLCPRQQKIFFEAMMLGDGSRSNGKINYYTSSKQLADDMQELILKIGLSADIIEVDRIGRDNGKNNQKNITRYKEYRLNIKEISLTPKESYGTTPLLLPYNGKIYCATVPNHIMYVRRNGRAVWCGNSWNSGGHPEWGPIPDGSFLIKADVAASMLKGNGSYAFSDFDGFPLQKLPNYGFDYLKSD